MPTHADAAAAVAPPMSPEEARLRRTKTVVTTSGTVEEKRQEIKAYFNNTYDLFEKLYECLACEEAFQRKPVHELRHPHIFYYGHTASFFINKLVLGGFTTRINPIYEEMFAIGVDEMQWDDLEATHYDFPESSDVKEYRDIARAHMNKYIDECEFTIPIQFNSPMWPVLMGIEHERIHLETSSVLIRELPLDMVKPHPFWTNCPAQDTEAPKNELVKVAPGVGKPGRNPNVSEHPAVYGWDCDYGDVEREVAEFEASKYLVSNKEMLEFVEDGGYAAKQYWTEEAQAWMELRGAPTHPYFWRKENGDWCLRTLTEVIPMPWAWPCEVNNHEAKAFCNWKSAKAGGHYRLLTEAEWHVLQERNVGEDQFEWAEAPGNVNLEKFTSACPVDFNKQGEFYDVVGNVWQHTETPTHPLKGYAPHALYDDFSMPTFDGRHNIQVGGAWISTGNEATKNARFAFRRHFYQPIGIRYVKGEAVDEFKYFFAPDPVVDQYSQFHYGDKVVAANGRDIAERKETRDIFPLAIAEHCKAIMQKYKAECGIAADIGCRSGRTSFELAKTFDQVQGIETSARYIIPGCQMREVSQISWTVPVAGVVSETRRAAAPFFGIPDVVHNTTFWQSDPTNLHPHLKGYSMVLVNLNLLERTSNPRTFLTDLARITNKGAIVVIASTYQWQDFEALRDYPELWLSGYLDKETDEPVSGLDGLKNVMGPAFDLLETDAAFPYSLPLTTTSNVDGTCEVSVWRKNA
eukprot:TRINITY_DN230_c1_g2_i5.p1 TRINITY_DN230_c1_g2~~TRINITY_DN230_c1_g2_i5.p1  ORF type:complete len:747 (+),score=334.25 TRINITY_DN230_c1_g2_i5:62-2302(+)